MKRCGAESQIDNDGDGGSDSDGGKETRGQGQGQSKVKGKYTIQDCIDKFVEREQLVRTYVCKAKRITFKKDNEYYIVGNECICTICMSTDLS